MKQKIWVVLVGLMLAAFGHGSMADQQPNENDREANYVGFRPPEHSTGPPWIPFCEAMFGYGNCPLDPFRMVFHIACDDEKWHGIGPFQGTAGVKFCAIVGENKVSISIEDELIDQVFALVACLWDEELNLYHILGTIAGSGAFEIPSGCATHPDDPEDTTRLLILVRGPPDGVGGSVGEVTLSHERVGP